MQKIENQYTFTRLEQITHVLLINSSAIRDISLGNGKCGLALYFFCLAHQTGNPMYKHYANQLLDEMSDALDKSIPTGFEDGFTGIGCTIEYLSRRKWIEDDTDEILEAFDTRIRQMLQYDHCGLNTLYHLLCYLTLRLSNPAPNRKPEQLTHLTEQLAFISRQIGRTLAGEPRPDTPDAPFDLLWKLPLALLCLNQLPPHIRQIEPVDTLCRQLHHKAEATLQSEITPLNRYYLLQILQHIAPDPLRPAIAAETLPPAESEDLRRGTAGLLLLLAHFDPQNPEIENRRKQLHETCDETSPFAGYLLPKTIRKYQKLGLLNGIAGIALADLLTQPNHTPT